MFENIKNMIASQFDVDAEELTANTSLRDDLGADSLDLLDLVMALEDEYSIEIDVEGELNSIQTIGDVEEFLKNKGIA